jgi:hypothetical protein
MVRPIDPSPELCAAVGAELGSRMISWTPVTGGFGASGQWVVETTEGGRLFVKAATTTETAEFLRAEAAIYEYVNGPFMPKIHAWVDRETLPFLILEDLSSLHWPPPWSQAQIGAVLETCAEIAATAPPAELRREPDGALTRPYWLDIAANPGPVERLNVASSAWFEEAMPRLIAADTKAILTGDGLVHADIRSDNVCIGDSGVKVVDWNWAFAGNPMLDVVAWLPSLRLEGGPPPWKLLTGEAALVAHVAGYFLHHATRPPLPDVRSDLRAFQKAQGKVALEWAAYELGLPRPTLPADGHRS